MPKVLRSGNNKLRKQHAVLHTASVGVKVLTINQKQVTLSTFRQLEEQSIFHGDDGYPDVSLDGLPWGTVNYLWKGCPVWANYHFVWQLGDSLRRMPLPKRSRSLVEVEAGPRRAFGQFSEIERVWGCPVCEREVDGDGDGDCGCRWRRPKRKYINVTMFESSLHGLFRWMGSGWGETYYIAEDPKPSSEELAKECSGLFLAVVEHLLRFEKLNQLFIAV